MQYCNHPHDTQTNEALNQAIANVAPKSMCYSGTYSLNSCIGVIIGVHNLGIHDFGNSWFLWFFIHQGGHAHEYCTIDIFCIKNSTEKKQSIDTNDR